MLKNQIKERRKLLSEIPLQQIKKFGIMNKNDNRKVGWGQIYGEI